MNFHRNIFILLAFILFDQAASNPIKHICESFKAEPAVFLFNAAIIISLLTVGGILAGNIHIIQRISRSSQVSQLD